MSDSTFLELKDHVGVTADGNLEPLVAIGVAVTTPTMIPNPVTGKAELGEIAETVTVEPAPALGQGPARIVPGTRIVEVADQRVLGALLQTQNWEQTDPPSRQQAVQAARQTTDAAEEAGTHTDPEEN